MAAQPPDPPGRGCQLASLGGTRQQYRPLWRTFPAEQRALLGELGKSGVRIQAVQAVQAPVLLLADPDDTQISSAPPAGSRRPSRALAGISPKARVITCPSASDVAADAIVAFLATVGEHGSLAA